MYVYVPYLATSNRTAKIPSTHHNGAADWLKFIEAMQDNAIIWSVFVPVDVVRCCTYMKLSFIYLL
jgi:hypothetical protein